MSFLSLVVKNLGRQRVRTLLTVLGISIGITTVVALGVITAGLKASSAALITFGGADFMVAQKGAADLSFSTVPQSSLEEIRRVEGVASAEGVLMHIVRVGSNPFFVVFGREPEALQENPPDLLAGRVFGANEPEAIILGERAASQLRAGVGDTVQVDNRELEVVGVFRSAALFESGGAYAPLATAQELAAKPGVLTAIFVHVEEGADPREVIAAIDRAFPMLATIASVGEYSEVDQGIEILDAANLAISVLAVGIGAIGVMNTMVMSVFERTREIGILRAVGWSGRRILRMIIMESLLLCVVAAVVGSALGVLAVQGVLLIETVSNLIEPQYSAQIFIRALGVAVIVALAGAAYPAFRAVRLTPMEALRYE